MNLGLQGKVAIVTGSSEGIGYATAHVLAQEGVRVVLCARRDSLLVEARDTIAKETGADLLPCRAMFSSCLTFSDWLRRQCNASAPSKCSSTMLEAFRSMSLSTWTMRSGIKC